MSYRHGAALQVALYQVLSVDPQVAALVGTAIYDVMPTGSLPPTYVAIGPEAVLGRRDTSGTCTQHDVTVSVVTNTSGFHHAKSVAEAVDAALANAALSLPGAKLVDFGFRKAKAYRIENGGGRRIDLTFRAHVAN